MQKASASDTSRPHLTHARSMVAVAGAAAFSELPAIYTRVSRSCAVWRETDGSARFSKWSCEKATTGGEGGGEGRREEGRRGRDDPTVSMWFALLCFGYCSLGCEREVERPSDDNDVRVDGLPAVEAQLTHSLTHVRCQIVTLLRHLPRLWSRG